MQKSSVLLSVMFITGLTVVSCSKTPDVRLTMCQDLTLKLLKSPDNLEWQGHKAIMNGHNDLQMKVSYTITESDGEVHNGDASCFYAYEQDEIGAETFSEPTAAYSTYPHKMQLDNQPVNEKRLTLLVNQVMVSQGQEAIVKTKKAIHEAADKTREGIEHMNQTIKEKLDN